MNDSSYPSDKQDKFVLRLPDGMRDRIKSAAEANNRSMNAEIVATLEEKYPAPKPESLRLVRLQAVVDMFDDVVADGEMTLERRETELTIIKDMILKVISKMTDDELQRARAEIWFPGELDLLEGWPPQGWQRGDGG